MNQQGLTREARAAMEEARRILTPHFAGEEVRLYVAKMDVAAMTLRNLRILAAIEAGEARDRVAQRESVSERHVFRVLARRR